MNDTETMIDPGEATFLRGPGEPLPGEDVENAAPKEPEKKEAPAEPEWKKELSDVRKSFERELKNEREARKEAEHEAREWHARATSGKGKEEAGPAEPLDLVDALSSGDDKQVRQALKQRGFVPADEIEALVERKVHGARGAATREAQLVGDYPDLKDEDSELYKATAQAYKELDKAGVKGDMLLDLAADRAAARLGIQRGTATAKSRRRSDDDEPEPRRRARERDDEGEPETEAERVERVAAQSGVRSKARASTVRDDDLTIEQKMIARKFGISEDAYRKRAARGVSISGIPRPR